MRLRIVPIELAQLNQLVARWHRHHKPVQGHRFSLGVADEQGRIVGGVSVGRPTARLGGRPSEVLEITRLVTDGTPNACSALYAAAARVGKEMGFRKIQTYILAEELGDSLKAAGWVCEEAIAGGGPMEAYGREAEAAGPTDREEATMGADAERRGIHGFQHRV